VLHLKGLRASNFGQNTAKRGVRPQVLRTKELGVLLPVSDSWEGCSRRHPADFAKRRQVIEIGVVGLRSFAARCRRVHPSQIGARKSEATERRSLPTRGERHSAPFEAPFAAQGRQGKDAEN
jgi:hypothetical protein